jgi:predicted KAP-like P-loop ATPase
MWSDNETERDFLNFRYVADIAAEMIVQANGRPLSMGISGSWGVGKSSMMKLLGQSLRDRADGKFLFVEFNAWLYQGYDDTRAALMEVIATALVEHAMAEATVVDGALAKANELLARVNWFRVASLGVSTVASLALGIPPVGLIGEGAKLLAHLGDSKIDQADIKDAGDAVKTAAEDAKKLLKPERKPPTSPPKAIHAFRDELEATLEALGVTLVVLIDDLDRCLPATAINTLEAMRLFLFLKRTAFVIAADDKMIRVAVRAHFKDPVLDDELVTNYFDKLIQVPIRVPPLGTQDVRAYLMMLFIENSTLDQAERDRLRAAICERLGQTWAGKRVDRAFVVGQLKTPPADLVAQLDLADRIAPILTTATQIAGNPRLIKRFLNTLSIRQSIARSQGVNVDDAALAKMLLFERCGPSKAYASLLATINDNPEGKPEFLAPLELQASKDATKLTLEGDWKDDFVREWLTLEPPLADVDLRGVAYVSRDHLPIITAADRLSSQGADLLEALMAVTNQPSKPLADRLASLSQNELAHITERLLTKARNHNSWGTPPILNALLTIAQAPGDHVEKISRFLKGLPVAQLTAPIVPLLADKPWAAEVLPIWAASSGVPVPVAKAIANASNKAAS